MSSTDKKSRATDSLRGIFALLIVWHHLAPMSNIPYSFDFGNTIVLFFFVLSGYGISLSWKDRIQGAEKTFLINRCSKIFPIQWITVILYVLFGINIVTYWAIPFHLTLTQTAVPFWQINFTMNVPCWFLSCIFFCYLSTPHLLKYATEHRNSFVKYYFLTVIIFELFIYFVSDYVGLRWLVYLNPFARLLDYSLGIVIGIYSSKDTQEVAFYKSNIRLNKLTYTAIEMILFVLLFAFMLNKKLIGFNNYNIIRYPIIVGTIIIFTLSKGYFSSILKYKMLLWLGNISMSIYMIHEIILHICTKMKSNIPTLAYVMLTYLFIIVAAYFTEKTLPFFGKYVTRIGNKTFNIK